MSRLATRLLLGILATTLIPGLTHAATATLVSARDNSLYEDPLGNLSNGIGVNLFSGLTSTDETKRALLAFDIASAIPGGSVVDAVTLTLNANRNHALVPVMTLHRVLNSWGEGASDAGDPGGHGITAEPGDATWIHRSYPTVLWNTPGGDFVAAASASLVVGAVGSYTWGSSAGLVADVQAWITAPSENHGWILIGDEATLQTANRFDSRESLTPALRPTLVVTYHTAASAPVAGVALEFAPPAPNPGRAFNLRFALPSAGHARLEAFDPQGRRVATLLDGEREAGPYSVRWDGRGTDGAALAPGVYTLRLAAAGETRLRRALLLP